MLELRLYYYNTMGEKWCVGSRKREERKGKGGIPIPTVISIIIKFVKKKKKAAQYSLWMCEYIFHRRT